MNINEKLMEVQKQLKAPKDRKNTFGGYSYRSCESILESVKPILAQLKCTLVLSDEIETFGNRYYVKATAVFSDGENDISTTALAREAESRKGMDDGQITGATSSYARKYALGGLFCIDDTKDADTEEFTRECTERAKKEAPTTSVLCADCKKVIADSVGKSGKPWTADDIVQYTQARFGRCLCPECMKKVIKSGG